MDAIKAQYDVTVLKLTGTIPYTFDNRLFRVSDEEARSVLAPIREGYPEVAAAIGPDGDMTEGGVTWRGSAIVGEAFRLASETEPQYVFALECKVLDAEEWNLTYYYLGRKSLSVGEITYEPADLDFDYLLAESMPDPWDE